MADKHAEWLPDFRAPAAPERILTLSAYLALLRHSTFYMGRSGKFAPGATTSTPQSTRSRGIKHFFPSEDRVQRTRLTSKMAYAFSHVPLSRLQLRWRIPLLIARTCLLRPIRQRYSHKCRQLTHCSKWPHRTTSGTSPRSPRGLAWNHLLCSWKPNIKRRSACSAATYRPFKPGQ